MEPALERANAAISGPLFDLAPAAPWAAAVYRARRARGRASDPGAILERWEAAHPGSVIGEMRYRWPVSHKHAEIPAWAGTPKEWTPWRPAEKPLAADPFEFEMRLSVPAIITECGEFLCELDDPRAQTLLAESEPVLRRDFAAFVQASHTWTDTFALWCLARRPRLLARMQPIALAIASTYAATTERDGGVVRGSRFPFHELPLVSASAQLASGLLALGEALPLIAPLAEFVTRARDANGGFADGDGPPDPLTTLVCLDLLLHVDPSFDPAPSVAFLASCQRPDGTWRAYGPEVPWLTIAVADVLADAERSFANRFRWPHLPDGNRDHKTRLPFFAWFDAIARLFSALPGLSRAPVELAFLDLAGFRAFNNAHGQDAGDAVLAALARELSRLPSTAVVRDGGDEFLVLGAPGRADLARSLDEFRMAWPAAFRREFGDEAPPVSARILVTKTAGGAIRAAREMLGRTIGTLKDRGKPGPEGLLERV